jgi:hypothetical protein
MEKLTARVEGGCMNCDEAAEFVSALSDGETIPRETAKHIRECARCRARLLEYAEIAAELRCVSSLQLMEEEKAPRWQKAQRVAPNRWRKGWSTVRIPTFAFALMLVAIIALASSLMIVKVRAHSQGTVLMLTAETASGRTVRCALSIEDQKLDSCASEQIVTGVRELYGFRITSRNGDSIELGVRAKRGSDVPSFVNDVDQLPETRYWFQPGEKLHVDVQGSGSMVISGELLDHLPPLLAVSGEQLDPGPGELRFVDPVLLRGKDVLHDFQGVTVSGAGKGGGIELCAPHDGRYEISLSPLRGAAEGLVSGSRISFDLNGQPYEVLTGAPVARPGRVWILHLPNDETTNSDDDRGFAAYVPMTQYLAEAPQD